MAPAANSSCGKPKKRNNNTCSAVIVTFVSSSPDHQPSVDCSFSSQSMARLKDRSVREASTLARWSLKIATRRKQRGSCEVAAADGRFHGIGPARLRPRARDRDGRVIGTLLRSFCADAGKPRRFRIARDRASHERCVFERREKRSHFEPGERFELGGRLAEVFVGGAEAAAQIPRLLFENPLQRRFERRYEIAADASAVVPKVDV